MANTSTRPNSRARSTHECDRIQAFLEAGMQGMEVIDEEHFRSIRGGSLVSYSDVGGSLYSVSLNYEKCTPTYTKRKKDGGSD